MNTNINKDFASWATGFSGCDGGNPRGSVWLCGIEYGGGDTEESLVLPSVDTPRFVGAPHWGCREEFLKYPYNWKALKLLAAMAGEDVGEYASFFRERSCFDQHSDYFKLNLYPIGFRKTSSTWPDWLVRKTGFSTKQEYLDWCLTHRFPALRKWVSDYCPRLVLCTGITFSDQFRSAFGSKDEHVFTERASGKEIKYFATNGGNTLVTVVHFLGGPHGLNSDEDLIATGKRLGELLRSFHMRSAGHPHCQRRSKTDLPPAK